MQKTIINYFFNRRQIWSFIMILVFFLVIIPFSTQAAGLIPCGGSNESPCTLCHFILGVNGLIKKALYLSFFIGMAILAFAAVVYTISAGDSGMTGFAKDAMKNATIGIIIMFSAWLMVNYTLHLLGARKDLGIQSVTGWSNFSCAGIVSEANSVVEEEEQTQPKEEENKKCGVDDVGTCVYLGFGATFDECPDGQEFVLVGPSCSIGYRCCKNEEVDVLKKEGESCQGTSMSAAAGTEGKCVKIDECKQQLYVLTPKEDNVKCEDSLECCSVIDSFFK